MYDDQYPNYPSSGSTYARILAELIERYGLAAEAEDIDDELEIYDQMFGNALIELRKNSGPDFAVKDEVEFVRHISESVTRMWKDIPEDKLEDLARLIEAVYKFVDLRILIKMLVEMDLDLMYLNIIYFHDFDRSPTFRLPEKRVKDMLAVIPESEGGVADDAVDALPEDVARRTLDDIVRRITEFAINDVDEDAD